MSITRERLNRGMTYAEFLEAVTRNRERFEANEKRVVLRPEDLETFTCLDQPLEVMALVEDWCPDVIANLPVLARLARETGMLNLHLFDRQQNMDLMAQFMNGPYQSIPVFAFFDQDLHEIGRFVERPRSLSEIRSRLRAQIFADHPEFGSPDAPPDQLPDDVRAALGRELAAMHNETGAYSGTAVVREFRAIAEGARTRVK